MANVCIFVFESSHCLLLRIIRAAREDHGADLLLIDLGNEHVNGDRGLHLNNLIALLLQVVINHADKIAELQCTV